MHRPAAVDCSTHHSFGPVRPNCFDRADFPWQFAPSMMASMAGQKVMMGMLGGKKIPIMMVHPALGTLKPEPEPLHLHELAFTRLGLRCCQL